MKIRHVDGLYPRGGVGGVRAGSCADRIGQIADRIRRNSKRVILDLLARADTTGVRPQQSATR